MAWIAGERVILRAWERDDVRAHWEASQSSENVGQRQRDWHEPPRSLAQMEAEFDAQGDDSDDCVRLIIEADGHPVGDIDLFHMEQRNRNSLVGLGIWRAEDRCHGYGGDALRTLMRWAFRHLNLHRIELSVDPDNAPALRVYRKVGFVEEGRRREQHFDDGSYRDEIIMGVLRREFEALDTGEGR
jgi:diamine N-acetyltransferase